MAKVENNPEGKLAKIALRKRAFAWLGETPVRVFDAFAGAGAMWRAFYRHCDDYVGCDTRPIYDPDRALYVADCERVIRSIDLSPFNLIDLDAFGSPWPYAWALAHRRVIAPGERVIVLLTDGAKLNARFGGIERCFAHMAGVRRDDASAHQKWPALTVAAATKMADLMGADLEWSDVRDGFGPSACQVYSAVALVGRPDDGRMLGREQGEEAAGALAGVPVADPAGGAVAPLGAD